MFPFRKKSVKTRVYVHFKTMIWHDITPKSTIQSRFSSGIPSILVYRYTDIPSISVYRYTDIPSILVYRYTDIPSISVYRYTDIPSISVYHPYWYTGIPIYRLKLCHIWFTVEIQPPGEKSLHPLCHGIR